MGKFHEHQRESSKFVQNDKTTSKFAPVPISHHEKDSIKAVHPAGKLFF